MEHFEEQRIRADVAGILLAAIASSGKTRGAIATQAGIHKDALRRVLSGQRSATLGEMARILLASDASPRTALALFVLCDGKKAARWLDTDIGAFLEQFLEELPDALERVLGNQLQEVKPRWAKGTAQRMARLLSEHVEDLERRDALYREACL